MNFLGMDARSGRRLTGAAHLRQSIEKILTTAIGSRLARRSFGSLVTDLIDMPTTSASLLQLYAAVATALMAWEPRLQLQRLHAQLESAAPSRVTFTLIGVTLTQNRAAPLTVTASVQGVIR